MDERARLLLLSDLAGIVFGTEQLCLFLYSIVRMHVPRTIVELGTGLGVSAFWMALAAKRNGLGHVWTLDDRELFTSYDKVLEQLADRLEEAGFGTVDASSPAAYFQSATALLNLGGQLTFVQTKIDLDDQRHFDRHPFLDEPVDLLFSDFMHGPTDILGILGHFLPRMAPASSVFIDSAPTVWSSYLLLEQLACQLNAGRVPKALQDRSVIDLGEVMKNRRIVLVHLTEAKDRAQNSTAWLKIEPIDVFAQPRTRTRYT